MCDAIMMLTYKEVSRVGSQIVLTLVNLYASPALF